MQEILDGKLVNKIFLPIAILHSEIHKWVIIIQDFYSIFMYSVLVLIGFFSCTRKDCVKGEDTSNEAPTKEYCIADYANNNDNGGKLKREEVEMVMEKLGTPCEPNGEKIQELVGSSEITAMFDEEEPSLEEVKEAFNMFDANNDGFIDAKELERVLNGLGFKGDLQGEEMIRTFDENGDGLIDFNEFVKVMEKSFN
ncbi:EF-hand domain [Dillenia turbinata]|uniref:EF-hand domain n=1 Tax=Dillenia turbinata TaxID=194707 RepID=A0AAN8UUH4_9MAGN